MALNAQRACELGARAIDINFGCPSPLVNYNDGGASLLRYPERIRRIVAAVRATVPSAIPVSAKLRLGWECMDDIHVNAEQAYLGGASWITIHARTKFQGYKPPAHWKYIGEVKKRLPVPIIANGDIWTREDFLKCQEETQCQHFMIGRGALANPSLVHEMAKELGLGNYDEHYFDHRPQHWEKILSRFSEITSATIEKPQYTVCRIKQWLKMATMRKHLPWFDEVKRSNSLEEIFSVIRLAKES
jgi:tRNA-dihydrouridine synthase C